MQFTTITVLLAAAMSAGATPLEARQVKSIRGTFYTNACQPSGATGVTFTFVQGQPGVCQNFTAPAGQVATFFDRRTIDREIRFYNKLCPEKGSANFLPITPTVGNVPGCWSQKILSYETI
ncbi:hypothetical protein GQ44DRAFT_685129 [Phaeosphaeriaceae sp. PMI808]|nr:hypothetical protein GQ44DRAFT_685129 [Phaeosphaeriaceae sp. PMI808]